MRGKGRSFAIAIGLILLALILWRLAGASLVGPPGISAAALTPAPTPADARQIAVLRLEVSSDASGEVIGVVLTQASVQPGFGPNVLDRPGAWTVSLLSSTEDVLRFGVPDPRQVRVESDMDDGPHTAAFEPEVEVDLIVPLSDPLGRDLAVTDLRLYDQPGNLIFAAGLRDGKIVPLPLRQVPPGAAG